MTEAAVALLEFLATFLSKEFRLRHELKNTVELLKIELDEFKKSVKEAEDENQTMEVAWEVEDVIEDYKIHVERNRRRNLLKKLFHSLDHHGIASSISNVKTKMEKIRENKDKEVLPQVDADPRSNISLERIHTQVQDHSVGLTRHISTLVKLLGAGKIKERLEDKEFPQDESNPKRRDVISIMGMGGLGKTKLAKQIYENEDVVSYFEPRAWVKGSPQHKTRDWLLGIFTCLSLTVDDDTTNVDDDELINKLSSFLQGKRYLIVMDCMWKNEVWDTIKPAFPDDSNGRILITSREKVVTGIHDGKTLPSYFLPLLDKEDSWQLLRNIVLREKNCSSDLEKIGRQLAEKCRGLPLSIVALAQHLKEINPDQFHWSGYVPQVNSYITDDKTRSLVDILGESYRQLPSDQLKSCFLYVGLFPKDFDIPARHLTQLWIAEGFVKLNDKDADTVAEEYLQELIDRSLIQVSSRRSDGGVKTCRVHCLLRDLSRFESDRNKFLEFRDLDSKHPPMSKVRRVSIQGIMPHHLSTYDSSSSSSSAHSLLLFNHKKVILDTIYLQKVYKSFKYIRLLYLWKVQIQSIPSEIEELIYLKCIRIWGDESFRIPSIPRSICNLRELEMIDIQGHVDECLPKGIWRMKQLRHLKVSKSLSLPRPPRTKGGAFFALMNLRILSCLVVDRKTITLFRSGMLARSSFPKVEKLHLVCDHVGVKKPMKQSKVAELFKSLENLESLKCLKIVNFSSFVSTTTFNNFPSTLNKITITSSYLDMNQLRILGRIPNLRILKLRHTYGSTYLDHSDNLFSFHKQEFTNLLVLQMEGLNIETWQVEDGAMPNLQSLVIRDCSQMRNPPNGLCCLHNLRLVEVFGMSKDFIKRLKELKMNKRCELHVDSIVIPNSGVVISNYLGEIADFGIDQLFQLEPTNDDFGIDGIEPTKQDPDTPDEETTTTDHDHNGSHDHDGHIKEGIEHGNNLPSRSFTFYFTFYLLFFLFFFCLFCYIGFQSFHS